MKLIQQKLFSPEVIIAAPPSPAVIFFFPAQKPILNSDSRGKQQDGISFCYPPPYWTDFIT